MALPVVLAPRPVLSQAPRLAINSLPSLFLPLAPPRHELEATMGDGRGNIRPVYVRPSLFCSVGSEAHGGVSSRLGVGAFCLYLLVPKMRLFVLSWALTRGLYALQNQNSLGQDPCLLSSLLDSACRGGGEYAYTDRPTGNLLTCEF